MSNSGDVARSGNGQIAHVDCDGVGASKKDFDFGKGLACKAGKVLGVAEAETRDHDRAASCDVNVGVWDAVDQVHSDRVLSAECCGRKQDGGEHRQNDE